MGSVNFADFVIPLMISGILIFGLCRDIDVFDDFLQGAKEGLEIGVKILPTLVALMTCVGMFRASGALDVITYALASLTERIGFPAECVPLALLRPISGSGALVVYENVLKDFGPDSYIGRVASVMQGSTETTFYTIAVYFSVTNIKKTRHTLLAALTSDFTGIIMSSLAVRIFMK